MIVLDTSIFIDSIISSVGIRSELAVKTFEMISKRGMEIYEPKILLIELTSVLTRYKPEEEVEKHLDEITAYINIIDYNDLHENALHLASTTGCRAIYAFFLACAEKTNSILISNNKTQIHNATKTKIESYLIAEENEKLHIRLQTL